jgi:PAS domain S-box-containing protein
MQRIAEPVHDAPRAPSPGIEVEQRLPASEASFRRFLADIDVGSLMLDREGRVTFINDRLAGLLGRTPAAMLGQDWIDVAVPLAEREALRSVFLDAMATGILPGQREDGVVTRSGDTRRLAWTSVIQRDGDGVVIGLASIAHDVTEARKNEVELTTLAAAIEQSAESVMITDREARITYVNRAFERMSGYSKAEVIGRNPRLLKSDVETATFFDAMWAALSNGLPWVADMTNRRKDGRRYQINGVISPLRAAGGAITGFVSSTRDVSHERDLETRADLMARERSLITETLRTVPSGGRSRRRPISSAARSPACPTSPSRPCSSSSGTTRPCPSRSWPPIRCRRASDSEPSVAGISASTRCLARGSRPGSMTRPDRTLEALPWPTCVGSGTRPSATMGP